MCSDCAKMAESDDQELLWKFHVSKVVLGPNVNWDNMYLLKGQRPHFTCCFQFGLHSEGDMDHTWHRQLHNHNFIVKKVNPGWKASLEICLEALDWWFKLLLNQEVRQMCSLYTCQYSKNLDFTIWSLGEAVVLEVISVKQGAKMNITPSNFLYYRPRMFAVLELPWSQRQWCREGSSEQDFHLRRPT